MATRGVVAIKKGNGWIGVYNHWDSYPTGLGKELWLHLQELKQQGKLKEFPQKLLAFDDWRNYLNGGKCEYCGKIGYGQACNISGVIYSNFRSEFRNKEQMRKYYQSLPGWKRRKKDIEKEIESEWEIRRNLKRTGYPDPEIKYHEHSEISDRRTPENSDPLFIEWVYVFDPENLALEILASVRVEGTHKVTSQDGKRVWDEPNYSWKLIEKLSLDDPMPDFEEIEKNE